MEEGEGNREGKAKKERRKEGERGGKRGSGDTYSSTYLLVGYQQTVGVLVLAGDLVLWQHVS